MGSHVGCQRSGARASDIDTIGAIDQSVAAVFSLPCSRIPNYYALRGCSRRCERERERTVRKEGRHIQQKAVEVPPVALPYFWKNILSDVRRVGPYRAVIRHLCAWKC